MQSDQGSYISWFSGEMFPGGQVYVRNYSLSEIPVFVKAGSVIPMKTEDFGTYKYRNSDTSNIQCYNIIICLHII